MISDDRDKELLQNRTHSEGDKTEIDFIFPDLVLQETFPSGTSGLLQSSEMI